MQGSQLGIGAHHEQPIETRIGLDFGLIDGEPACGISQEAAVSGIADQCLVALRQFTFEPGQQGVPGLSVLAGLFRVAGKYIATPTDHDVLDGKVGFTLLTRNGEWHRHAVIIDHGGTDLGG